MKNCADNIEYKNYLDQYNYIFEKSYFIKQEIHILTDEMKLFIDHYNHSYAITDKYGKSINAQKLILLNKQNEPIYTTKYAFGKLFYHYIRHSNNNEYLISGNDLMEFSVYNITKKEEYRFVSECRIDEDSEAACDNEFWYIKEWIYNPINNVVAINGPDGMNCSTVTICDLTTPEQLPIKFRNLCNSLAVDGEAEICTAIRWTKENALELEVGEENPKILLLTEQKIVDLLQS